MEEKNPCVELDAISRERMEQMGIDTADATHEEIMRFAAIASAHYLRKIRFWVTLWSVVTLLGAVITLIAAVL